MYFPTEDVVINALNHEIRREILRLVEEKPKTYTNLLNYFSISSGKLNYHLKLLTGFIQKDTKGFYEVSILGKRVLVLLNNFQNQLTDEDKPLLKRAYFSQIGGKKSFLHIRLVGGIYLKIVMLCSIVALIIISSILYALEGVNIIILWPLYLLMIIVVPIGLVWIIKSYKPAKEFAKRVDSLLNDTE
ncbi:MAG: ArsR family transcriptional regulator [Promethearchaeota archaeon]